jgi:hypothetical protein
MKQTNKKKTKEEEKRKETSLFPYSQPCLRPVEQRKL